MVNLFVVVVLSFGKSVHRQCLAEVAREVGVEAAQEAHPVGEQLQGQNGQQGSNFRRGRGNGDDVMRVCAQARVVFANGDGPPAAAGDFIDPADDEGYVLGGKQRRGSGSRR